MAVGIPDFPTNLDTEVNLVEAANNAITTLSSSLAAGAGTINVTSTTGFPNTGILKIDNELIAYTSKTSTAFTVQTINGRGYESTTDASHSNGATVELVITAYSNNAKNLAIIALEEKLGTGSSTPTAGANATIVLKGTATDESTWATLTTGDLGFSTSAGGGSTVVLTKDSAAVQELTGTGNRTFRLPVTISSNANAVAVGQSFTFVNRSTGLLVVQNSASTILDTVRPNQVARFTCNARVTEVTTNWTATPVGYVSTGGLLVQAVTDGDAVVLQGRAGGTSNYTISLTPATLSASRTLTLPNVDGTLITTGDTSTVTNTMLAGSIANNKLTNSAITIAGTSTSLGDSISRDTVLGLSTTGIVQRTAADTLSTVSTTGTGNIVLATNPVMTNPTIDIGITGVSSGRILGFQPVTSGVNYVDVYNAISSAGPTLNAAGTASNIALNLQAKGTGIVECVGNALRITGSSAGSNGIVQARGGTSSGGQIQLYELTTNGTNWVGFRSPDLLAANLEFQLPSGDGTAGQAVTTNGAGVLGFSSFVNLANPVTFKNLLINGDMRVDQRNSGGSVTINSATNIYTVDRWLAVGQAADGVFTVQQSTTAPTGFQNSIIATVTTADTSISSTQFYGIAQYIEGLNSARLLWGTANAKTVTLSFWVRCSATGTFGGAIRNGATNRAYPFQYTISAANTFEYKTITIPGDTSGTWATDNTSGPQVWFSLGAGSSRAGTAGAWNGNNNISATGATNLIGTLNATFYVSGVQLEENSTATPFEYLPIDVQLGRCLRYLYRVSGASWRLFGTVQSPNTSWQIVYMPVATRASVSLEFNLSELIVYNMGNLTNNVPSALTISQSTPLLNTLNFTIPAFSGSGFVSFAYGTASSFINLSAEL